MAKKGLTKQEIYSAASQIAATGIVPTQAMIRQELGSGSEVTIQKYLKAWKQERLLRSAAHIEPESQNVDNLLEYNSQLETTLAGKEEKIQGLLTKIADLEQGKINCAKEIEQYCADNCALEKQVYDLEQNVQRYSEVLNEVRKERGALLEQIVADKNKEIAELKQELREINKSSLEQIRMVSHDSHDLLMQEKVTNINLADKVKTLERKNKALAEELLQVKQNNIKSKSSI